MASVVTPEGAAVLLHNWLDKLWFCSVGALDMLAGTIPTAHDMTSINRYRLGVLCICLLLVKGRNVLCIVVKHFSWSFTK